MIITAQYSFNNGFDVITNQFAEQFLEIQQVVSKIDALPCKTKESREKTMRGVELFSPPCLNNKFKQEFNALRCSNHKEYYDYIYGVHLQGDKSSISSANQRPFIDMDFIKPGVKLGVEVQFGKYAFMAYNVCAKMTIFHNFGIINAGVEIVPTKHLADEMSA